MKILTTTGLTKLIELIKSNFISKNDTVETDTLDIDTTVTSGSSNLITSGAVYSYHDSTKYDASNPNGYQTAGQVSSAISSATSSFITKDVNNLTNYTTTTNLNTLLAGKQPVGDYATNTTLTNGLATKQDKTDNALQTSAKTVVGAINEVNAKSVSVEVDGITINKNTSDELQAIAVIDQKTSNALKTWTGTKVQYDAITTKDSNTLYNITDDSDITLSLLEIIYPVGSIYITTNNTCPLSALFGTWQLVGADRVLQGAGTRGSVGTTLEESLPNIKGEITGSRIMLSPTQIGCFQPGTHTGQSPDGSGSSIQSITFDASRSSSTYQDNAPVQPDAYLVNIYRRIA